MMTFSPVFRSPISAEDVKGNASFSLEDMSGAPVTLIQGPGIEVLQTCFSSVPVRPGEVAPVDEGFLARLTALQCYLFGATPMANLPTAALLEERFRAAGQFAHATDYSGGTAILRLMGEAVPVVLSKLCGLDFHPHHFPNLHVAQTSVAKIKTMIARHDEGAASVYSLHVDAPSGQYLWDVVLDAGQEFL